MKVVILAGGFGTRISEESQFKPKPMIEIGGQPILWHIMKIYWFFVKFWGAKVSMHSWRGHALNTVRVLFRCVC